MHSLGPYRTKSAPDAEESPPRGASSRDDREAALLLMIFATVCAAPAVRTLIRGEVFDLPTSAACAFAILSSCLLAIQLRDRARRAREERDRSDGGSP